jgi:hypothetical protein
MGSQKREVCDDDDDDDGVAADYSLGMESESSVPVSSIAKGSEGHRDGELIRDDGDKINVIVHATQNTAINCFRTINGDTHQTISVTNDTPDDRVITSTQLRAKINEYNDLSEKQRDHLFAILMKL